MLWGEISDLQLPEQWSHQGGPDGVAQIEKERMEKVHEQVLWQIKMYKNFS